MGQYNGACGQFEVDNNFILHKKGAPELEFKKKLPQVMSDNVVPGLAASIKLELQRFNKIYFHSKMNTELTLSGDI